MIVDEVSERALDQDADVGSERSSRAYDLLERAKEFLRQGHPHQAAMLLAEAKLIEPDKASIRETLARALYLSGRAARARREFAKAVQIDPVNDYAHYGLALSCARTGERTRAIAHLKLAIAMRPGNETYQQALARIAG
jgi:Flp pilus assembly protein TadD